MAQQSSAPQLGFSGPMEYVEGLLESNSLGGAWVLDISRSDTMEGYLRCMDVPDFAIVTQVNAEQGHESRNVIRIEDPWFVVHKRTKINCFTEKYEFDLEKTTPTRHGERRSVASPLIWGQLGGLIVTTTLPTEGGYAHMVETRKLLQGGHEHVQEIRLSNLTTGLQSVTRRTWVRVPMTLRDHQQLLL